MRSTRFWLGFAVFALVAMSCAMRLPQPQVRMAEPRSAELEALVEEVIPLAERVTAAAGSSQATLQVVLSTPAESMMVFPNTSVEPPVLRAAWQHTLREYSLAAFLQIAERNLAPQQETLAIAYLMSAPRRDDRHPERIRSPLLWEVRIPAKKLRPGVTPDAIRKSWVVVESIMYQ